MNDCCKLLQKYIVEYIIKLYINDEPFEYYWLNTRYPQCVIEDMSDYEIAYKYPLSGERFVLDCWSIIREHSDYNENKWEVFIVFIDEYLKECLNELNQKLNEEERNKIRDESL